MKDRRLTPANKRVADPALQSDWPGVTYVEPEPFAVHWPLVDLMNAPEGHRDRQLLFGDTVGVYETHEGWAFVRSDKDGYVGYVPRSSLASSPEPTHRVSAAATHVYEQANFKSRDRMRLSHGCQLHGMGTDNGYLRIADGYVPLVHCSAIEEYSSDPVSVAKTFLDTPYLWGGNSRFGIDCSGLIQAAFLACGTPCPGDSDLQEESLGYELPADVALERNDLLFWKGHVAMIVDEERLIHANAHHMAVTFENIENAIRRIERQGDGPITKRKRVVLA